MNTSLTRREFLRISGGTASAGLVYLLLKPKSASANIKPPGALPEPDFSALCLRCGKCTSACEQLAIQIDRQGFPYIDGLSGWCDFSGDCVAACPSGALEPFEIETVKIALAVIDRDRCIAWNSTGCRWCYQECLDIQDAIWIEPDGVFLRPHIDETRCNGCGACVNICPRAAEVGGDMSKGKAVSLHQIV
ncbi:MAG: 4Fe-4S dicluster domain-containing protein [Anaerolineales bacterium]|nr:4Fe-4S dicluster domain-containing protein [Chloroflexota bacterium]MBL6980522.1 4Fe-4S dicluster domain-containing protein [Anaerolineales bacterium]